MQKCEIMLNDLIDSKRTNTNIKATMNKSSQTGASLLVITFLFILATFFWGALKGRENRSNLRPQTLIFLYILSPSQYYSYFLYLCSK